MTKTNNSSSKAATVKKANTTSVKKSKKPVVGSKKKILMAIAGLRLTSGDDVDRKTVQGIAGMKSKGSFDTTLLNMKKDGLIEYTTTTVRLTQAGLDELGDAAIIPATNEGIQDALKDTIKQKKSKEIFDILTDGKAYSKAEIAKKLGVEENKSFGTYLSALSKVSEKVDGKIRLKDEAFPIGRP